MALSIVENVDALIAAGHALEDRGEVEAALEHYRRAVVLAPDAPRAHMNVGNALRRMARGEQAIEAFRGAIACAPDYAPAHFNLGSLLRDRAESVHAETELLEALRLQPSMIEAANVLADLYETEGRFDDAEAFFERALKLAPNHAATLLNYGMYWSRRTSFDRAIACFRRARAQEPEFKDLESVMLFALNCRSDVDVRTVSDVHRMVGAAMSAEAGPPFAAWTNAAIADRPLRIGYVSGDFLMHPVAVFLRPVLEQHDREHYTIYCYSNYPHPNPVADFMRDRSDHWCEVAHLGDAALCDQIRRDEIDVLVDLSGHTARHRLPVFAKHPAPVQATWLGYLNTTGLPAMDYRICDRHTDPPGCEDLFIEQLARLPGSQWCYMPWHEYDVSASPHASRPDAIVFGSFNQDRKVSDDSLRAWSQILARVPAAELLVLDFPQPAMQKVLLERVDRLGVDPARVTVLGRESIARYFHAISNVDVALDTFPYGGATTTLDTLWMGVPIVGLHGDRGISRGSYSILRTLGADELIASTPGEYVDLNVRLALDGEWRHRLRETLRDRLLASPLMDARGFTQALESKYREMWRTWCRRHTRR